MLKSLLLLLLAASAAPAPAADDRQRRTARAERPMVAPSAEPGDEQQQRPMVRERQRATVRQRPVERASPRLVEVEPARDALEPRSPPRRGPRFIEVEQRDGGDSVRDWRRDERRWLRSAGPAAIEPPGGPAAGGLREHRPRRIEPLEALGGRRAPIISRIPSEGTQPPLRASTSSRVTAHHWRGDWRGDWRSDRRYDWRSHRRRHRWLFHFGIYLDPFGWSYRSYSIGWRLWPGYYRRSYWLNDPWSYRLPYAPAGYRWIRYYDDALLVDTWDGRVVDVIHHFFW